MNTTKFLFRFAMIFFASLLITTTSCTKDEEDAPEVVNEFAEMTKYMKANAMDLTDMKTAWIITATDLDAAKTEKYIIDIRSAADFTKGHIPGAHNATFGGILTEAAKADKPIVVVCYTGQTAAHAHVALRLSGYADCSILKFGFSAWSGDQDFDKWTINTGDVGTASSNWSSTNTLQANVEYSLPSISTSKSAGAEILEFQVAKMIDGGFKGVNNTDVLANPSDYFINNYWALTDVEHYGHISTAHRVLEDLTIDADGFKYLDKDMTVVTYCWTGQTSSLVTAYLNVLGYDAKSLKFGTNGMIYSALESHKWTTSGDLAYE